ncbi:MAG TPA: type II toxin-antitoxin system Phd/YefM family antitoxin [Candidatus Brocadiaceae bacterium]|jgi:prevent-host-death family protein
MKNTFVSVAQGKKDFSRLLEDTQKTGEEIIVTKRGKPVAVIISYGAYQHTKRTEGYKKILEARETFIKTGLTADKIFEESRKQLEDNYGTPGVGRKRSS